MNSFEGYNQEQNQENGAEYYKNKYNEAKEELSKLEAKYQVAIKTLRSLEYQENDAIRRTKEIVERYDLTPFYWLMLNADNPKVGYDVKIDMEKAKTEYEEVFKTYPKKLDRSMKHKIFYNTLLYGEIEGQKLKDIIEYAKYISPSDLNKIHDENGDPMLFYIVGNKEPEIIRQFLSYGVDITVKTKRNEDIIDMVMERYKICEDYEDVLTILKILYEEFGAEKVKRFNTKEGEQIINKLKKDKLDGYEQIIEYLQKH